MDLDRFHLSCGNHYNMWTMGQWIDAAARKNVKVLDLMFCTEDENDVIELPCCLVTYGSLTVLRLSLSAYSLRLPKFTCFPGLRVLELNSVKLFDQELLKEFLKSYPLLEDLTLVDCVTRNFDVFCISCPKLKNLKIDIRKLQPFAFVEWVVEGICKRLHICCPKLVYLEFAGFIADEFIFESLESLKKAVIHPEDTFIWRRNDARELFAGISHTECLSLPICLIKTYTDYYYLLKSLPNLKTLELTTTINADNMDVLIQILTCSPNVESLHIIIEEILPYSFPPEVPDFDSLEMECAFEELTIVKMTGMSDVSHHLEFIEFLLENILFLETMSITPCVNNMTDSRLRFLTHNILKFPRASPEAEIIIK